MTSQLGDKFDEIVEILDVEKDAAARDYIVDAGFQQAPVVMYRDDRWQGFRPDKIKEVTAELEPVA